LASVYADIYTFTRLGPEKDRSKIVQAWKTMSGKMRKMGNVWGKTICGPLDEISQRNAY